MADVLRLVTVTERGEAGKHLGTMIRQNNGKIITSGSTVLDALLDRVMLLTSTSGQTGRREAFDRLAAEGWSNGKVMLVNDDREAA